MAEAGGPALSEIQARPAGVVERVKGKLREVLTPTGRAEVLAQKQIDAILVQVPEDKRAEAMQILESKRPEFVAGEMEDAKGSLVRDAVIVGSGVAALGGLYGLSKVERVRNTVSRLAQKATDNRVGKGVGQILTTGKDKAANVVNWILRRKPRDFGTKMATGVAAGLESAYQGFPKKPVPTQV